MISLRESIYIIDEKLRHKRRPQNLNASDEFVDVGVGSVTFRGKSNLASARGISSAELNDPALNEWTPLPSMSTLRYKCVGVTWQGKIYLVGGFAERGDSDLNMLTFSPQRSSAEVFDMQAGRWDLVARMWQLDVPPNQIVAVDSKLFSSGDCLKPWKGHTEVYDGKLNMWDEVDGSRFQNLNPPIPH
ncbi:hypothetical protein CRYUN_Cryun34aG0023700 [Craigia yunnanensis]